MYVFKRQQKTRSDGAVVYAAEDCSRIQMSTMYSFVYEIRGKLGNGKVGNAKLGNGKVGNGKVGNAKLGNGKLDNGKLGNRKIRQR